MNRIVKDLYLFSFLW